MERVNQILTSSLNHLKEQTSLAKNSDNKLARKPTWTFDIVRKYGNYEQVCERFSYLRMANITADTMSVFRDDTPSLVRLDVTYGKGAADAWLYDVLQSTLLFLGVTNDKFSKEQVVDLARTISSQYRTLSMAEILLFLSRFKAGRYGRFYGGDSYALVITEALNQFEGERLYYLQQIQKENERKEEEQRKQNAMPTMSYEEYQRLKQQQQRQQNDKEPTLFDVVDNNL